MTDGPFAARLGEISVQAEATRALVLRAADLVDAALAEPDRRDGVIDALIATDASKSLAYELGPAAANELPLFAAAGDPEASHLERGWRNSRTHSLHDPVRWRQHYTGDFHLNGRLAPEIAARFAAAGASRSD